MNDHSIAHAAVTLDLTAPRRPSARPTGLHNVGETTGMFRARTAEAIQVEMEREVDMDDLPEYLRRFLINPDAR